MWHTHFFINSRDRKLHSSYQKSWTRGISLQIIAFASAAAIRLFMQIWKCTQGKIISESRAIHSLQVWVITLIYSYNSVLGMLNATQILKAFMPLFLNWKWETVWIILMMWILRVVFSPNPYQKSTGY